MNDGSRQDQVAERLRRTHLAEGLAKFKYNSSNSLPLVVHI